MWVIRCPVLVKVKFKGMYILSCLLTTYLKELRKAAENKISIWNCVGCVSSDMNDKLKGLKECVSSLFYGVLSVFALKKSEEPQMTTRQKTKVYIVTAKHRV
jgi:hypothetical protein